MVLSISNYLLQIWRILNRGSEHRSVVSDSLLLQARVHSLSFLHGIFPTQWSNPGLPHCGRILYQLSYRGSPRMLEWVAYPFSSGSSWPRNQTGISCITSGFFINRAEAQKHCQVSKTVGDITSIQFHCAIRSKEQLSPLEKIISVCYVWKVDIAVKSYYTSVTVHFNMTSCSRGRNYSRTDGLFLYYCAES